MTPRDERRHRLLQRLEEVLGADHAAALMESLPPDRWDELATRADLERFATKADLERFATRADLERFATKADLERFATRDELHRELAHLVEMLTERIDGQGHRLEALVRERVDAQTKLLVFSLMGAVFTTASLAFAAAAF